MKKGPPGVIFHGFLCEACIKLSSSLFEPQAPDYMSFMYSGWFQLNLHRRAILASRTQDQPAFVLLNVQWPACPASCSSSLESQTSHVSTSSTVYIHAVDHFKQITRSPMLARPSILTWQGNLSFAFWDQHSKPSASKQNELLKR